MIVAVSVLAGAKLLAGTDDSVTVWAARSDLSAGTTVASGDLVGRRVAFGQPADVARYLTVAAGIPVGARLVRPVGAGELLPRAAVGRRSAAALVEVPLSVPPESVPVTVEVGSVVDVWVTPDAGSGAAPVRESVLVFDDVRVVSAPRAPGGFGPASVTQLVVGVAGSDATDLAAALARTASGTVVVTRQD